MGGKGSGQARRADVEEMREFVRSHSISEAVGKYGVSRQRIHQLCGSTGRNYSVEQQLRLFILHPSVRRLFDLRYSRDYFADEAKRIANGGQPIITGWGLAEYQEAAQDAQKLMNDIMAKLSIDGQPVFVGL